MTEGFVFLREDFDGADAVLGSEFRLMVVIAGFQT